MFIELEIILWLVGFVLLMVGSTMYPLAHEFSSAEDFKKADRRAMLKRYLGGTLMLLAFIVHWLS